MNRWFLVAFAILAVVMLGCMNPVPEEPAQTPFIQVCIENGEKVECPERGR